MATVPQSVARLGEGLNFSRETRTDLTNLLQNCPVTAGKATLTAGSVVVSAPSVLAGSVILLSPMSAITAAQNLYVSAIVPGVSFTITDAAGTYAGVAAYAII